MVNLSNAARPVPPHGLWAAFISLGMGGFFIGTGEFVSMSLLPDLANAMSISVPAAGAYISAYAIGVMVGAPLLAITAAHWPRKTLLNVLLLIFAVGYAMSALAWNHASLLVARFIGGLPHGAYYGVACLVAASLVDENKKAQAAGYVMAGLAVANVLGVPAATWIGQHLGWRAAFGALTLGGIITIVMLTFCIPALAANNNATVKSELSGLKRPLLWLTLVTAAIGFGGMFSVYSYITPTLTQVSGFALSDVPLVLALWGMGMVFGNVFGGRMADRNLIQAIFIIMAWNVFSLALFAFGASNKLVALVALFMIGCGFALVPALQVRLMDVAGQAQTLAAALNHSAFNLSNAIGASLGGWSIAYGWGWTSTGWIGCALALFGIALMMLSIFYQRWRMGREPEHLVKRWDH